MSGLPEVDYRDGVDRIITKLDDVTVSGVADVTVSNNVDVTVTNTVPVSGTVGVSGTLTVHDGALVTDVPVNSGNAFSTDQDGVLGAVANQGLFGYSIKETAGATAEVRIMHGTTVSGGTAGELINLLPYQSVSDFWPKGVDYASGLSIDIISGTVQMVIKKAVIS